jgi:hypothetical protein
MQNYLSIAKFLVHQDCILEVTLGSFHILTFYFILPRNAKVYFWFYSVTETTVLWKRIILTIFKPPRSNIGYVISIKEIQNEKLF